MAITSYSIKRVGDATYVTVTSGLSDTIYYHWYIDGAWVASSRAASWQFQVPAGAKVEIIAPRDVQDACRRVNASF